MFRYARWTNLRCEAKIPPSFALRVFVAITDWDWFSYLSQGEPPDEVNFWQPSGNVKFRALQPGEPFLFKLHSPRDFIVGGGFFSHFTILPASFAWKTFGPKNGAQTEQEMRGRIEHYRKVKPNPFEDYEIGCILLQAPFFFDEADWIPVPEWSRNIVRGRGYDTNVEPGKSLRERVQNLLAARHAEYEPSVAREEAGQRYGSPQTVLPRLGQGSFRVLVTDAYKRRCAFTRTPVLHVLEAAHIKPYSQGGTHSVTNGILLRQDFHTLFDEGYLTVTTEHKIEVSRRIKEEFENGHEYYSLSGHQIALPEARQLRPAAEVLRWHNENIFRG